MITVLSGVNSAELDKELKKLLNDFVKEHDELAVERLDGEEADFDQLLGAVSTLPFLAEKKLVIIKRLSGNKTASERVEELIAGVHDSVDLVLVESKLDKRSVYYKTVKKLPGFREFKDLDERNIVDWVIGRAVEAGGKIGRAEANLLISRLGPDQQRLQGEITKLVLYNPEINKDSIELLTDMTPRSSVFNMLDKAFAGETAAALKLYEEQRQQNVEPFNILALIVWQLNAIALAKTAGQMPSDELAKKSGLSPFTASKAQTLARSRSLTEVTSMVSRVAELEYASKTSAVDIDDGLRNFIVSL